MTEDTAVRTGGGILSVALCGKTQRNLKKVGNPSYPFLSCASL
jgi:hypothetical protein